MAISLNSGANKVQRSGSYITTTAAFTMCGWAKQGATTPSGSTYRQYYAYGDSAALADPYIYVGSPVDSNDFILEVYDGITFLDTTHYAPTASTYFHWAVRYDGATTADLIINGVVFASLTTTISGITFTTKTETVGVGGWSDFIFANIGVYSTALTLPQIIVQSQGPFPRYFETKSFTPLSPWEPSVVLHDFSASASHPWVLTGSYTPEISPTIPVGLPYDTQFEDAFDSWNGSNSFDLSATHAASNFTKPTQGCNYRNLYTGACHQSLIQKFLVSPPDVPITTTKSVTPLSALSFCVTGAAFSTIGNVPDITTSVDATLAAGVDLMQFTLPLDTVDTLAGSFGFLIIQTGGKLSLSISTASGGFTNFVSALNAFPLDGLTRGLQVSLNITSLSDVSFIVLVDNAVVITGSFGNVTHAAVEGASSSFGLGFFALRNHRDVITTGFFTAYDRVRIVADSTIVPWSGCSTATPLVAAATFCALPDRTIPVPTTTTYPTVRERVFALPFATNLYLFLERIEFLIQAGEGLSTGQGSDPVVGVWFSKDGGKTYGNGYTVRPGKIGEFDKRSYLNRLGRARNWVCKIRVSDPVFWAFLDCYIDMSEGTS